MANIVMLGPPGCGKGTQAEKLSKEFGFPQISTGNILRHAIEVGTKYGLKAKAAMDCGELVSDEVVDGIIEERLTHDDCKNGFILDGFPRDLTQAQALEGFAPIDFVFEIRVNDEVLIERLGERRVCDCGHTYHNKFNPPKFAGVCNECGGKLYQRDDDKKETIKHRLEVYHQNTEPLIEFYRKLGKLTEIGGSQDIDSIYSEIRGCI